MKKPLPPLPQWTKHLKPNSWVTRKEVAELFGIHHHNVGTVVALRTISFYVNPARNYGTPKHHYLWSDVLKVYNNEIKEAEK